MENENENNYKFEIQKINLKNTQSFIPKKINIFIGANNCGKTQVLKDILSYITKKSKDNIIVEDLEISNPSSWEEISTKYNMKVFNKFDGNEELRHISPTFDLDDNYNLSTLQLSNTMNGWLLNDNRNFWKHVGAGLVTFLNTDNRLKLIMSQQSNNLREYGAKNVLEAVYLADTETLHCEISNNVRKKIREIFNTDIYLDTSNPGILQYRVGRDFSNISDKPQDSYKELSKYPLADDQGDGLRSALGIISAISAVKRPIILLDEPEAFLHPPQALQLGKSIVNFIDNEKQIFISTHSADFLRGLLSSDVNEFNNNIEIVHLNRNNDNNTEFKILDKEIVAKIIKDPLLSSSRVLEGMFYKGVVATEGDADAVFYQRAFQKQYPSEEIHFVNAHNKQTLKKLIEPYKKLGIKFAMIADADVIRDTNEFKSIISISDNEELKKSILDYRRNILEYFQSKSKYDLCINLNNEIKKIILKEDSITESNAQREIENVRKKLKKLREKSDELYEFKQKGQEALVDEQTKEKFNTLYEECSQIGLFIVKVGELESWLIDYDVQRISNKSKWISEALNKLSQINYEPNKNIWKFIDNLYNYFNSK